MALTPDNEEFWTVRGIDPLVRDVRPYPRYYKGDVSFVQRAFAAAPTAGQKATTTRKAKAADGVLIMRHAVLPDLAPILPEIRPDDAISTARAKRHWHGDGKRPEGTNFGLIRPTSKPGLDHRWKWHTPPYGVTTAEDNAARARGEQPGNVQDVHVQVSPGKYHFSPNPRKDTDPKPHDHATAWKDDRPSKSEYVRTLTAEEKLERHIRKHHTLKDEDGNTFVWEPGGVHEHVYRVADRDGNTAARLDMHPWAADLLENAEEVFFGLEGCLKADAILTAIRREGRPASVFSVPSVTLWGTPELERFVRTKLQGKRIIITPDSDWIDNPLVIEQARLCRTYLRRRCGHDDTYVAAPPLRDGAVEHKGVDDYLGSGGTLDGLMVQHRMVRDGMQRSWLAKFGMRKDRTARDAETLYSLAAHVGATGDLHSTLDSLAKVVGVNHVRVGRAIKSLQEIGAITIDGRLDVRKQFFTGAPGWRYENPVITLREDLRGVDDQFEVKEIGKHATPEVF